MLTPVAFQIDSGPPLHQMRTAKSGKDQQVYQVTAFWLTAHLTVCTHAYTTIHRHCNKRQHILKGVPSATLWFHSKHCLKHKAQQEIPNTFPLQIQCRKKKKGNVTKLNANLKPKEWIHQS